MEKKILLGSHGRFAEELIKSAEMIVGELKNVRSFSLLPGMSLEEYMKEVDQELQREPERTLCLVDLFGGTPSNTFCALSGLNLGMLLEVYMNKDLMTVDELAELAVKIAQESSKNATEILKEG